MQPPPLPGSGASPLYADGERLWHKNINKMVTLSGSYYAAGQWWYHCKEYSWPSKEQELGRDAMPARYGFGYNPRGDGVIVIQPGVAVTVPARAMQSTMFRTCDDCDQQATCTREAGEAEWLCTACHLENLKFKGEYTMSQSGTHHMVLRLQGEEAMQELFHAIAFSVDDDYPIRPDRKAGQKGPACSKCEGLLWTNPTIWPEGLKRLAKQCSLKLKLVSWLHEEKCPSKMPVLVELPGCGV